MGDWWRQVVYWVADLLAGGRSRACGHDCLACALADEIANPSAPDEDDEPDVDTWAGQVPRPATWPKTSLR